MSGIRIWAAFLILPMISLTACQSNQSAAEKAVREALKDPDSAKFGDFYFNEETGYACLFVNAKNSMGGYVGDHPALLKKSDSGWEVVKFGDDEDQTAQDCQYSADHP